MMMVTVRLKIRTGLFGGQMMELSVTRPNLSLALAATVWALVGRRALALADLLSALRSERAVGDGTKDRIPGDPFGLGVPRQPHVTVRPWGLDGELIGASLRGLAAMAAAAATMVRLMTAQRAGTDRPAPEGGAGEDRPPVLPQVDLTAVRQAIGRTDRIASGTAPPVRKRPESPSA